MREDFTKKTLEIRDITTSNDLANEFFSFLGEKYNISKNDLLNIIKEKEQPKQQLIPISIFQNDKLSALEAVVKYMKEDLQLPNKRIATLIGRDNRTIWCIYSNACKKLQSKLAVESSRITINPIIFSDRNYTVLEHICLFLKEKHEMTYTHIANTLRRDYKTVYTVCSRAKKKEKRPRWQQ